MSALPSIQGYSIERLIASGGTADVYLAHRQSDGRQVALKVLNADSLDDSFTERFLKEGRLIASLRHPGVIRIDEVGVDKGCHYIAMELIEGGDLDRQIQSEGRAFTPLRALAVLRDVATCLQFVHERGIIHRDVKPANVLFRKNGSLVLTDFGIAKEMENDVKLTQTGSAVGSPAYSSPEQSQGMPLDVRTDIYSLGVMFLEMLLGYNPYRAETYANTSMNHIQMAIPRLEGELRPYQDLINRMLAKRPEDRFPGMEALLAYLANPPRRRWLKLEPSRWPRPRTAVAWVAVLSSLLLLAIGGYFGWDTYRDRQQVHHLLALAEQAVAKEKLLTPENESALTYYRQVLEIDGSNQDAKAGIQHLAGHYYKLATDAWASRRYRDASLYVTRGLSVDPYHVELINLKAEMEQGAVLPRQGPAATSSSEPENEKTGFFHRLFN
jgi:serine/threonine protein kinase